MKLSEAVVEGIGENAANNNDTIEELSNDLARKIKIMNDLKESTSNNTSAMDNSNVDRSIEETFRDKSIAKSFGAEDELEEEDEEPGSPHKRKVENGDVEDTMTMSSYAATILSLDDFLTLSSGLVTTETTLNIYNKSLYQHTEPSSQLFEPIR